MAGLIGEIWAFMSAQVAASGVVAGARLPVAAVRIRVLQRVAAEGTADDPGGCDDEEVEDAEQGSAW